MEDERMPSKKLVGLTTRHSEVDKVVVLAVVDKRTNERREFTERELLGLVLAASEVLAQVSPRARAFPTSAKHYVSQAGLRRLARAAKEKW